jgi:hypothetical protein
VRPESEVEAAATGKRRRAVRLLVLLGVALVAGFLLMLLFNTILV